MIRRADYVGTPIRKKLELTSPTSGGRPVGIVRSRTQATKLLLFLYERLLAYKFQICCRELISYDHKHCQWLYSTLLGLGRFSSIFILYIYIIGSYL
jgi:hypothetical protein